MSEIYFERVSKFLIVSRKDGMQRVLLPIRNLISIEFIDDGIDSNLIIRHTSPDKELLNKPTSGNDYMTTIFKNVTLDKKKSGSDIFGHLVGWES